MYSGSLRGAAMGRVAARAAVGAAGAELSSALEVGGGKCPENVHENGHEQAKMPDANERHFQWIGEKRATLQTGRAGNSFASSEYDLQVERPSAKLKLRSTPQITRDA